MTKITSISANANGLRAPLCDAQSTIAVYTQSAVPVNVDNT